MYGLKCTHSKKKGKKQPIFTVEQFDKYKICRLDVNDGVIKVWTIYRVLRTQQGSDNVLVTVSDK